MTLSTRSLSVLALATPVFLLSLLPAALSHPGGRDRYGCHHDRKHGGYHCHAGPLAGQSFTSQAEMLATRQGAAEERPVPAPGAPVAPPRTTPTGPGGSDQVCIREHRSQQIMCGEPVR